MTVELRIIGEGNAWNNFCMKHLADTAPTIESVNEMLAPYNARITRESKWNITFDTEQDKAFFILKWA